ncbi:MAG TPA: hypothetical protein VF288_03895 [Mycobacteriales bacterium]
MTTTMPGTHSPLRRAAVRALRAPSIHNTQPWRFDLTADALEIWADRSRQLRVLDPHGRQLSLSVGCALFNARVALAAGGVGGRVERCPDPLQPDLLGRLTAAADAAPEPGLAALDAAIDARHTNRRAFHDEPVPAAVVSALVGAAAAEGAELVPVVADADRYAVARLSQQADALELTDPGYRAELRSWTSDDGLRLDGVPAAAVPHVDATSHDELPLRDFDTRGTGALPAQTNSGRNQCLLVLCTPGNGPADWVRAGEALERVLLEVAARGYAASPFTSVVEVATTYGELRRALRLAAYPHVLLRVGRAPQTPATRRRKLVDVLHESP